MTVEDLTQLATDAQMEALEAAWLESLESPGPAGTFLAAIEALPSDQRSAGPPLLLLLLEAYQKQGRHVDVLPVVRALLPFGPRSVDLKEVAREAIAGLHSGEDWSELFLQLSGLAADQDLSDALERFERLTRLLPGCVVYHRSGWGEGLIESVDVREQSFNVRFREDGMTRSMPFTTGLDVLIPLKDDDLRARLMTDAEGLAADAAERPAVLVRAVTRLHKGKATAKEVKHWLIDTVVPARSWASWWKKAKTAAVHDPYLSVDNPARPVFILRKRALSPEEELRANIERVEGLAAVLDVVRGPLGLDPEPAIRDLLLEHLDEAYQAAPHNIAEAPARFEALLLLVRHGKRSIESAAELISELVEKGARFVDMSAPLSGTTTRREALELFIQTRPQLWSDTIIEELTELPGPLLDVVVDRFIAEGRGSALANRFHIFLLSPSRQPVAVLRLARSFGSGRFDDVEGKPRLEEVVMGVLHLAETQAPKAARGDKPAKEIMKALQEVLLRKRGGLLKPFTSGAPRSSLEAAVSLLARCRSMPDDIATSMHHWVEKRFPGLVPREEIPFWETGSIYCSRAGLARREEEYRVLIEVKIPENSEAIGKAASYGDLSENFEWTAAIEQQRQLTEKAAAMIAELKVAQAIEDQVRVPDVVAPGMTVTYEQDGKTQTITILGPWDTGEGVLSYNAPVAAGMLGARAGDTATLDLPEGSVSVTIVSVTPALPIEA